MTYWDYRTVDIGVCVIANLVNILMTGIFLSRPRGLKRVEYVLGLSQIALGLPLLAVVIYNAAESREIWFVILPLMLVVFLLVELLLDYILKLEFRSTRLLVPYLLLFYLALMGMVGYAFQVGRSFGFVTLGTYFLQLFAAWYSYAKIGHGEVRK
jgi:hypothetical protein